jgi:protein-glutamine gamma-glutamyltransferase
MINIVEWNWNSQGASPGSYQWNIQDPIKKQALTDLQRSPHTYTYQTVNQLMFELNMRKHIIGAAQALNASGVEFTLFKNSRCNPQYWHLTSEGGFRLKSNVLPSAAILDIYSNGRAYGFECAAAIIIVFYKAALDSIGGQRFNELFQNIYLYSWEADQDLGITTLRRTDYMPGDAMYFKNPDVDPSNMEFRGENVINLGKGQYYGHGIGIGPANLIINELNRHRKPDSTKSAYLLEQTTRPNFQYLSAYSNHTSSRQIVAKFGKTVTIMGQD